MKKAILFAAVSLAMLSGCSVTADLHDHQKVETKAMKDYHKAERKVVLADEAIKAADKISSGAKVAAHANKALAVVERQRAYSALVNAIEGKKSEVFDAQE